MKRRAQRTGTTGDFGPGGVHWTETSLRAELSVPALVPGVMEEAPGVDINSRPTTSENRNRK